MDQDARHSPRPLTGPAFGPAGGADARWLVVLLHGVGADGADLIGLAPRLAEVVPGARILAPHAPEPCDMAPVGRQWFSLQDRGDAALHAGAERARPDLEAFLATALAEAGLGPSRLILAGFSQGAMAALHAGLRRDAAPAAILALSGALIAPARLAAEIACRPPVLIVHGEEDPVVSPALARRAEKALRAAGVAVEAHLLPGLGHGIDERAFALTADFLKRVTARA
ncbi:MAG TPA: dienelactone hydrolase family protein [Alphaproteobacteria bacterium]